MNCSTLKILVVDDEPGMRRGAERALKNYSFTLDDLETEVNFEAVTAADGYSAYSALDSGEIDLVLLDYKLPDVSGLDILNTIREKKYGLLTIMITAYSSIEVAISATKNGAYDFLAKPFTPDELRNTIKKAARNLLLNRKAKKLAEEKRQVRFQFLSVLSHELKAPLNAVEGYMNILDQKVAGNDLNNYEEMVRRCLSRINGMRKLIFDLLDLTRIESGQKKRELEEINVRTPAEKSIETLLPDAEKRKITIELHAENEIKMYADPGELEIIFNNLISNAVKYNRENGKVDIYIDKKDDTVTLKTADTGIGMTQKEQKKLFREFVRIKNKKTRLIEGSGLGLSILKRLSSLYEGNVNVESEPDKGSVFIVLLKNKPPAREKDEN